MPITVDAIYENGVLRPVQPLALHEHQHVRVTVEPQLPAAGNAQPPVAETAQLSLGEEIAAMARALPPGALDNLPDDLASEHDHYLYGTPKRSQ